MSYLGFNLFPDDLPPLGDGDTFVSQSSLAIDLESGEVLSASLDAWTVIPAGLSAEDAYWLGE